nr:hypothetical protein BaRGS_034134 [Batillaria attramentaria]
MVFRTHFSSSLEQLQLGYQQGGLSDLYDQLYEMVQKAQNRTLAGDVDMFALNIHTLLDVTLRFPALAPTHNGSSFSLQTVANFMNILLSEAKKTNEFEKRLQWCSSQVMGGIHGGLES